MLTLWETSFAARDNNRGVYSARVDATSSNSKQRQEQKHCNTRPVNEYQPRQARATYRRPRVMFSASLDVLCHRLYLL